MSPLFLSLLVLAAPNRLPLDPKLFPPIDPETLVVRLDPEEALGKRLPTWHSSVWSVWQTFPAMRVYQPTCGNETPSPDVYEAKAPGHEVVFYFGPTGLAALWMYFPWMQIRPPTGEPAAEAEEARSGRASTR